MHAHVLMDRIVQCMLGVERLREMVWPLAPWLSAHPSWAAGDRVRALTSSPLSSEP